MPPQLLIIYSSAEVVEEGKTPLREGQVHGKCCPFMEKASKKIIGFIL